MIYRGYNITIKRMDSAVIITIDGSNRVSWLHHGDEQSALEAAKQFINNKQGDQK